MALGSTGVISNLKNKFEISNGQRQTSTVLLFFENHKYCELVLKIGVVCDGKYHVQDQQFKKWNSVYFAHKNYINSNPLPKEWMEIFGEDC